MKIPVIQIKPGNFIFGILPEPSRNVIFRALVAGRHKQFCGQIYLDELPIRKNAVLSLTREPV